MRILHEEFSVPHVVISSIPVKNIFSEGLPASLQLKSDVQTNRLTNDQLLCISSSRCAPEDLDGALRNISTVYARIVPQISGYFSGVGDLFSALVLAHFPQMSVEVSQDLSSQLRPKSHTPLSYAATQALTKTYAILELTHEYARNLPEEDRTETDEEKDTHEPDRKIRRMKGRELRIVQSQDIIRGLVEVDVKNLKLWHDFWKD